MALNWSKLGLLFIALGILALPGCVILLSIVSPSAPEMPQPADTSTPRQPDLLQAFANHFSPKTQTVNVSGTVMNDIGQPAVNVNVSLWRDGILVDSPDNPQYSKTGWSWGSYQPNGAGTFKFRSLPNVDYEIRCEKDGYTGSYRWDPYNPIPVPIMIKNPNVNVSYTRAVYDNVSASQIEEAREIAFANQSVRQMLDGTDYSIEYITKASDDLNTPVLKISVIIGTFNNTEGNIIVNSHLLICVDLTGKKIAGIQHGYDCGGVGCGWNREIPPGSYVYFLLKVYHVNESDQAPTANLSFTCPGGAKVRPMILGASDFQSFQNGEPYNVSLYGDEIVTSSWSGGFTIQPNRDYYYVIVNENPGEATKINSNIDLKICDPILDNDWLW